MENQKELWELVYGTLWPKKSDANACLNRLTTERPGLSRIHLDENTAIVREEQWSTEQLAILERKHEKVHGFGDDRPIVVVEVGERKIVVDGNHRVTRWLRSGVSRQHRILLIRLR